MSGKSKAQKTLEKLGLPACKNIGKKGKLPRLYNLDGTTGYPRSNMDDPIDFKYSQYEVFPVDAAIAIGTVFPKAWCKGGNHFGNYAFAYFFEVEECIRLGKEIPEECLRWMKKRESYIARHRGDFRLAGIIAMIKWAGFVDGPNGRGNGAENGSSMDFMLNTIIEYGK